jgi:hypothetical protein
VHPASYISQITETTTGTAIQRRAEIIAASKMIAKIATRRGIITAIVDIIISDAITGSVRAVAVLSKKPALQHWFTVTRKMKGLFLWEKRERL